MTTAKFVGRFKKKNPKDRYEGLEILLKTTVGGGQLKKYGYLIKKM